MADLSGVLRLTKAELRALPWSRGAPLAAAGLLLLVAFFGAVVWVEGPDDALLFDFVLLPTFLIPLAAWRVAQARGSRFLQAVFTTPVRERDYLAGQFLTVSAIGLAGVVAILPFFAVHAYHLGLPASTGPWLLVGIGMVLASTALGLLVGILSTSRGSVAALVAGFLVLAVVDGSWMLLTTALQLDPGPLRDLLLRFLHVSPGVLLLAATGIPVLDVAAASPGRAALAFLVLVVLACAAAFWIFTRAQSVEAWEATPRRVAAAALLVVAVVLAPAALADVAYERSPGATREYTAGGANATAIIVERGAGFETFTVVPWARDSLPAGRTFDADLLVAFFHPANVTLPLEDVRVRVSGTGLGVEGLPAKIERIDAAERGPYARGSPDALLARLPVRVTIAEPPELAENWYAVRFDIEYRIPNGTVVTGHAFQVVEGEIPGVRWQMAGGGAIFPLALVAAWGARRWRTR